MLVAYCSELISARARTVRAAVCLHLGKKCSCAPRFICLPPWLRLKWAYMIGLFVLFLVTLECLVAFPLRAFSWQNLRYGNWQFMPDLS